MSVVENKRKLLVLLGGKKKLYKKFLIAIFHRHTNFKLDEKILRFFQKYVFRRNS